jgi:acyl carrier protein
VTVRRFCHTACRAFEEFLLLSTTGGTPPSRPARLLQVHRFTEENASMATTNEIHGKVASVLMEALNVEEHEIKPAASLQGDLGAESIDFLDIVFRLEREFGVRIPRGELFPESIFQGDPEFVANGKVTDQGMRELRLRLPYADLDGFDRDRRLSVVTDLFTVDLITRYIAWKLAQGKNGQSTGQTAAALEHRSTPAADPGQPEAHPSLVAH